ncbi:MAG TPA: hypothetical protein VFH83_06050 [Spirochaetia bacterium]|nr:hypothetical protein [Spirochaetia bacterium]
MLATVLAVLLAATTIAGADPAPLPDRTFSLPKSEVNELFLAYLTGVIAADAYVALDHEQLASMFPELGGDPSQPFRILAGVARVRGEPGPAELVFSLSGEVHVPIPFGLLWYHPISVHASRVVRLGETRYPVRMAGGRQGAPASLAPAFEYRVVDGEAHLHVDSWLVFLTGGLLDEFSVRGAALFRYQGDWYGLVAGVNPHHRVLCWAFDLTRMRLVLSPPEGFLDVAMSLAQQP